MNDSEPSRTSAISAMTDGERRSLLAYISGYAPEIFDDALKNWRLDMDRSDTETGGQ